MVTKVGATGGFQRRCGVCLGGQFFVPVGTALYCFRMTGVQCKARVRPVRWDINKWQASARQKNCIVQLESHCRLSIEHRHREFVN